MESTPFHANKYHLLATCLLSTLCTTYGTWNVGLEAGLGFQVVCNVMSGLAFICYCCCASELSSTFPFPGGSYALARCTLGFFPGYLVGCCELFYYILSLGLVYCCIGQFIILAHPPANDYIALVLMFVFVFQFGLCVSKRVYYWSVSAMAVCVLGINLCYILGAFKYVDFDRWAYSSVISDNGVSLSGLLDDAARQPQVVTPSSSLFIGNSSTVLRMLPTCLWLYVGTEFVNLTCDDVLIPRRQIPFGQTFGIAIIFIINIAITVLAASMDPGSGGLTSMLLPLQPGFSRIFGIDERQAICLQLLALFGAGTCLGYSICKLFAAMADSKLLPVFLSKRWRTTGVPVNALFVGHALALAAIVVPGIVDHDFILLWPDIIGAFAFWTYIIQLIGYCSLQIKLSHFPRYYVSPFGLNGALFAMAVLCVGLISSLAFREESLVTITVLAIQLVLTTLYYHLYARDRQTFSSAEKLVMLPAHADVLNANGACIYFQFISFQIN
jgi:ethanolamine permease